MRLPQRGQALAVCPIGKLVGIYEDLVGSTEALTLFQADLDEM